jgi:hypothetical protein
MNDAVDEINARASPLNINSSTYINAGVTVSSHHTLLKEQMRAVSDQDAAARCERRA